MYEMSCRRPAPEDHRRPSSPVGALETVNEIAFDGCEGRLVTGKGASMMPPAASNRGSLEVS